MEALWPLLVLVALIAGVAGGVLWRRGLRGDLPMVAVCAGVTLAAVGGLVIEGPVGALLGGAALLSSFFLEMLPALLRALAQLARLQGRHGRALWMAALVWLSRPTWSNWVSLQIARGVRAVEAGRRGGAQVAGGLQRRLDAMAALRRPRNARALGQIEALVFEGIVAVGAVEGRWGALVGLYEGQEGLARALALFPTGASSDMVRALAEVGRLDDAAQLVRELNAEGDEADDSERSDAFLNKARITLLAYAGMVEALEGVFERRSALRGLFGRAERRALMGRAARPAPSMSPWTRQIARETASALQAEARLSTTFSNLSSPSPAMSAVLIGLAAIFVAEIATGSATDPAHLAALGGHLREPVLQGQWWRLITATFLHAGIVHLSLNGAFLLIFGNLHERLVGPWRFLTVYLLSGIAGALAAALTEGDKVGVGASGAIFGVIGACLPAMLRVAREVPPRWLLRRLFALISVLILNTYIGLSVEFVSLWAHAGGLAAGVAIQLALIGLDRAVGARAEGMVRGGAVALWGASLLLGGVGLARSLSGPLGERPVVSVALEGTSGGYGPRASVGRLRLDVPADWVRDLSDRAARAEGWPRFEGTRAALDAIAVHCSAALPRSSEDDGLASLALFHPPPGLDPFDCDEAPGGLTVCQRRDRGDVLLRATRREPRGLIQITLRLDGALPADQGRALLLRMATSARIEACDLAPAPAAISPHR